ncbi:MAG: O-antigen translocase [Bacteroidales bacterium]
MADSRSSYRQIFKATSLFGGVQVFNIIIAIIRSKIIAVLLGPTGMGISGLFTSTTSLVGSLTNFGLGTSAVRNISEARETNDNGRISKVITVLSQLLWITGVLGLLLTFILAPTLSKLTFGNENYTIAFRWLSITLLFTQLTSGQNVLLQGMRQLKFLAQANLIGSAVGLLISVPLYYFYRIDGIVPALIISSFASLIITWSFSRRIKTVPTKVNKQEMLSEGKSMLTMGFMLSLSGLITTAASYIIRAYISNTGSLDDVGLYNAGFAIIGTYVGLIFTAMGTDYYPRLSGIAQDNVKAKELMNQQAEIALLIMGPILCIFLIFANWAVILLYSTKFTPINGMIQWSALGMYFKAASWSIAFIFLAKGAANLFFWNEFIANMYILLLNMVGYHFLGLNGLGISFMLGYFLYLIQVYIITRKKYGFSFNRLFFNLFFIQFLLGVGCYFIIFFAPTPWAYIGGTLLIGISAFHSIVELNKRLDIKGAIVNIKKKKENGGNHEQ